MVTLTRPQDTGREAPPASGSGRARPKSGDAPQEDPPSYSEGVPTQGPSCGTGGPASVDRRLLNPEALKSIGGQADAVDDARCMETPPVFAPYHASYSIDGLGNITSHDPHLNSDPEALLRFLFMHLKAPPEFFVKVVGEHTETTTETITHRDRDGRITYETRDHQQEITDFSFMISVVNRDELADPAAKLYVVDDAEPAYRGSLRRSCVSTPAHPGAPPGRADLESAQIAGQPPCIQSSVGWREERKANKLEEAMARAGFPPFLPRTLFYGSVAPISVPSTTASTPRWIGRARDELLLEDLWLDRRRSTRQDDQAMLLKMRGECDAYCARKSPMKELTARRSVFGWNLTRVGQEITQMVRQTGYNGRTSVTFASTSSKITVRPPNFLAQTLSLHWVLKLLLSLLLIYPILYLLRRVWLGPRFDTIRSAFALSRWRRVRPGEQTTGAACIKLTGGDTFVIEGDRETVWVENARLTIQSAVQRRAVGQIMLREGVDHGYRDGGPFNSPRLV